MKRFWPVIAAAGLAACTTYPGIETHLYRLPDPVLSPTAGEEDDGLFVDMSAGARERDASDSLRHFLEQAGMDFPQGAKVTYNPENGIVTLRNTPDNHALLQCVFAGNSNAVIERLD
jgi:hypothetical protein